MPQSEVDSGTEKSFPFIKELQKKYAPDKRTAIFNVVVVEKDNALIVRGEVENPSAKKELMNYFSTSKQQVVDSVEILPSSNLGDKPWGIITVSVANMRTEPAERAELVSQVLMGTPVKLWKKKNGYVYAQSPDGYLGWVDTDQLHRITQQDRDSWNAAKKIFITSITETVRQQPSLQAFPVCDAVGGDVFKLLGTQEAWAHISLADGRTGYIQQASVINEADWGTHLHPQAANIERTAKMLMGVPYLWGGTSVKGVDCSGFTKTVFLLNGQLLQRDASQQVHEGIPVDPGKNFENLAKGDLVFLGTKAGEGKPERIVHVGIYLGNKEYIHSSGKVGINSFDPASPIFSEYNLNRFVRARRVLPQK